MKLKTEKAATQNYSDKTTIEDLQKENQEMREALKDIVDSYFDLPSELRMQKGLYECERSKRAREALKKIKEIEG